MSSVREYLKHDAENTMTIQQKTSLDDNVMEALVAYFQADQHQRSEGRTFVAYVTAHGVTEPLHYELSDLARRLESADQATRAAALDLAEALLDLDI